jgi:hypothetical protein
MLEWGFRLKSYPESHTNLSCTYFSSYTLESRDQAYNLLNFIKLSVLIVDVGNHFLKGLFFIQTFSL